ncbi:potassium transporter TrkG [Cytophagaceae bacterium ABcell3]|nr:potassium transporter TrkG [Cytophagaceae bacterium ABcell3]
MGYKVYFAKLADFIERTNQVLLSVINRTILYLSLVNLLLIVYRFGFEKPLATDLRLIRFFEISLVILFLCLLYRLLTGIGTRTNLNKLFSEYLLALFVFAILSVRLFFPNWFTQTLPWIDFLNENIFLYISITAIFFIEVSRQSLSFFTKNLNPARIFIYSFLLLIFTGTGLLLLPRSTVEGISLIDALFTSTSAVCVTGLVVLDTAKDFTLMGKIIIMFLFQTGGLGIMTFTSFFGFLFKGGFSFQNEIFLQNMVNEDKMGEIFKTIFKIIAITLGIEFIAAIFIYLSVDPYLFQNNTERAFFSIFHAVSAFCNAGFSILSDGLYDINFRYNYNMQLVIAFTIILGGLGFPIVFNLYKYLKHYFSNKYRHLILKKIYKHEPRIINVNTKIVILTTSSLLALGFVLYFITEYNNTLVEHSWYGKIVTAFFGAVTPRTAGFNTVDTSILLPGTVLIYIFLMWVGASPGSTGGGIKTSAFAVAVLNTLAIAKGQNRLDVYKREISDESVKRAFAIILLSVMVIGLAILFVTITDAEKPLISVAFECFSAYSTVGLSLGITSELNLWGKIIIIITMFLGRVGTLTIIISFVTITGSLRYKYPQENVFIN